MEASSKKILIIEDEKPLARALELKLTHEGFQVVNVSNGEIALPMLEKDVVLTPELIKRYAEELETVNGQSYEGVVINHAGGSFKVLSLSYDARK